MSLEGPYDARAISNLLLDMAGAGGIPVSNLALQKLLYFAHARHLVEVKQPLVTGYFEAWQHGPVPPCSLPSVQGSRRSRYHVPRGPAGPSHRAGNEARSAAERCRLAVNSLGDGFVWPADPGSPRRNLSRQGGTLGLHCEPSENKHGIWPENRRYVISERFKFHKISVGAEPVAGEPVEDTPFT